jgi:hypothetical protein
MVSEVGLNISEIASSANLAICPCGESCALPLRPNRYDTQNLPSSYACDKRKIPLHHPKRDDCERLADKCPKIIGRETYARRGRKDRHRRHMASHFSWNALRGRELRIELNCTTKRLAWPGKARSIFSQWRPSSVLP